MVEEVALVLLLFVCIIICMYRHKFFFVGETYVLNIYMYVQLHIIL
jgi:hypothetical protein